MNKKIVLVAILIVIIIGLGLYIIQLRSQIGMQKAIQSLPTRAASVDLSTKIDYSQCASFAQQAQAADAQGDQTTVQIMWQQWLNSGCNR